MMIVEPGLSQAQKAIDPIEMQPGSRSSSVTKHEPGSVLTLKNQIGKEKRRKQGRKYHSNKLLE